MYSWEFNYFIKRKLENVLAMKKKNESTFSPKKEVTNNIRKKIFHVTLNSFE